MNPLALLVKGLILGYRWTLSPLLPVACRYRPTCSEYALEAVARHGTARGGWLAASRLMRCHPWGGSGFDPVPALPERHRHREAGPSHP